MKNLVLALIIISLPTFFLHSQQQNSPDMDELIAMAKEFVTALEHGHYDESVKHFDETMTKLAPPEKMKENRDAWDLWMPTQTQWRASGFGLVGLDYPVVFDMADRLGIKMNYPMLRKMQVLERTVVATAHGLQVGEAEGIRIIVVGRAHAVAVLNFRPLALGVVADAGHETAFVSPVYRQIDRFE